jgi:hypothetical protein
MAALVRTRTQTSRIPFARLARCHLRNRPGPLPGRRDFPHHPAVLPAAEVRSRLIQRKGYTDNQLPSAQTIGVKLNALGFCLRKVAKFRPQKK